MSKRMEEWNVEALAEIPPRWENVEMLEIYNYLPVAERSRSHCPLPSALCAMPSALCKTTNNEQRQ